MATKFPNKAAWIPAKGESIVIRDSPNPELALHQVRIKVAYTAINQLDAKLRVFDIMPINFPTILGLEVTGKVVETNCPNFKVGDTVLATLDALSGAQYGGFQKYTIAQMGHIAKISDEADLLKVVTAPVAIFTTVYYFTKELGLDLPDMANLSPPATKGTVLVYSGSSATGAAAIQFAVQAGYKVVTTCSSRNANYVRSLGAHVVIERSSLDHVITALRAEAPYIAVYDNFGTVDTGSVIAQAIGKGTIVTLVPYTLPAKFKDVVVKFQATPERHLTESAKKFLIEDYFPLITRPGSTVFKFQPADLLGGLDQVQHGLTEQMKGVSAKKLVIAPNME
ncbi:chaperonin 10-like protein [Lipomyces kononenkoae]|uniref:Chaperonin 10-like protein n=1 Tax=Lipomyces kononenkoae TaxID=34357 RepID=A0ACC3T437_LIPKO